MDNFRRAWTVPLNCLSTEEISLGDRTRLARPDIKTGVPYSDRILREADGLDLDLLASPHEIMDPKAFLKEANL